LKRAKIDNELEKDYIGVKKLNKENIKSFFKPTKKKIFIWIAIILVLVIIGNILGKSKKTDTQITETDMVTRGDIEVTITGSASVEPYERYEIIPKVSGDIIYCPFDVGDQVQEGDLLYGFDTSNSDLTVERQKISLQQSENNYKDAVKDGEKLYIKAKNNGIVSDFSLKVGQEVKNGAQIATVSDTNNLEVVLPFTSSQISSIYIGSPATITSSKHMSSVSGTVTHIASGSYAGSDGTSLYNVTISFENPGVFYSGMSVGGSVGNNISPGSGVIENNALSTLCAETNGTVTKIYHTNGDYVTKGTIIAALSSEDITDKINDSSLSYRSANLSMQQTQKDLEDYNITSPISGTVITKNSKAGDTIDKTNSSTTMMVVADISRLKFSLSIDELDVSKVSEGQLVSITCDALPDESFTGAITTVSVEGSAQNGVTTYSAEVVIDEPGNLRPSMNIDASDIVESASNVLMVPSEDIKTIGNKSYVFVKGDNDSKNASPDKAPKDFDKSKTPTDFDKDNPPKDFDKDKLPDDFDKDNPPKDFDKSKVPTDFDKDSATKDDSSKSSERSKSMLPEAPDGYVVVEIETGLANEDYTEVKSGLQEGQEIYKIVTTSTSDSKSMMGGMGGMSGGMGGGPSGGMGGGPSGGPSGGMR